MASRKQIAANRRNALKSSGPTSAEGKARSGMNALRHGAAAESVVVPAIEDPRDWEAHRAGTLESLAPVGHLETVLAERVAGSLWRLGRAVRYERELINAREQEYDRVFGLKELREKAEEQCGPLRTLESLQAGEADRPVTQDAAMGALYAVAKGVGNFFLEDISYEPVLPDDVSIEFFKEWTTERVRGCVEIIAEHAGSSAEELCAAARARLEPFVAEVEEKLAEAQRRVENSRGPRRLPEQRELDTVTRYESHLERAAFKALHELQRVQAARAGGFVHPPAALDITGDG